MDNKLSELSKPVAYKFDHGVMGPGDFKYGTPQMHSAAKDENASPLYSQEYVSALLAELEAKEGKIVELRKRGINAVTAEERTSTEWQKRAETAEQRIAELEEQKAMWVSVGKELGSKCDALEAKLATPVRLPEGLAQKIKVTGYYEALNEMMDCVRAAGFKCVGDE